MVEKSRTFEITEKRDAPQFLMSFIQQTIRPASLSGSRSDMMLAVPMIPLRGVLSSWDTWATNMALSLAWRL